MWISKKEWNKKQDKISSLQNSLESEKHWAEYYEKKYLEYTHQLNNLLNENHNLREKINTQEVELIEEAKKYKQLYLDELQKRLELAEIVRKMNGE